MDELAPEVTEYCADRPRIVDQFKRKYTGGNPVGYLLVIRFSNWIVSKLKAKGLVVDY